MSTIDLNADVGESFGRWTLGDDEALFPSLTSANVACGGHAGDPDVMRATVRLAKAAGVAVGAHPGFADLAGFGRRELVLTSSEVENLVLAQVGALAGIARGEGVTLRHVKPHGALYNMAARDRALADAISRAVAAFDSDLLLVGLAGSALLDAGRAAGLRVVAEGFADRGYEPDGRLTPRSRPGAVLHDPDAVVRRAVQMVRTGRVMTTGGVEIAMPVATLCLHGDTPGAAGMAARLKQALLEAGISVRAADPA